MKKKKTGALAARHHQTGYLYLIPWLIGFLLFVAYPLFYTGFLSFNSVVKNIRGWTMTPMGIDNYFTALFQNTTFTPLILDFAIVELTYVPTIVILSFILAVLLNTKIKFRTGFRMIYFFPVIVLSGPVVEQLMSANTTSVIRIEDILIYKMIESYSEGAAEILLALFNNFTIVLWFTGIPIVLFMNGLQKINTQLFEAAQIDGASPWQILWKVTIPIIKPTALICTIFSIVQIAIFSINPIYGFVLTTIQQNYSNGLGFAAAVALIYSLVVFLFVGIAFLLLGDTEKVIVRENILEKQERKLKQIQRRNRMNEMSIKQLWKALSSRWRYWIQKRKKKGEQGGPFDEDKR